MKLISMARRILTARAVTSCPPSGSACDGRRSARSFGAAPGLQCGALPPVGGPPASWSKAFAILSSSIINDGSTDRSQAILERFAKSDPRIRLVNRSNQGYSRCLNQALELACGTFLARMDADDESLPDRFEAQLDFLDKHPEVVAVSGQWIRIDPSGHTLSDKMYLPSEHNAIVAELLKGFGVMPHPGVMMRTDAVRDVGGYRVDFEPAEDLDLWLRLADRGRLANLNRHILRYRLHPKATSSARRGGAAGSPARRAVVEARQRRGEAVSENFVPQLSRADDAASRSTADWARMAMESGRYGIALRYAAKAFFQRPSAGHGCLFFRYRPLF